MKKINFITAYAPEDRGGGWNGVNAHLYEGLRRRFEVVYVGPINPGPCRAARLISRFKKLCGLPREFYHYSRRRLDRISRRVQAQADPGAAFDFHHGAAPWSACTSPRPYGGYIDASFDTYISLYHHRPAFAKADIRRICSQEAQWLAKAAAVFCASEWTLGQTVGAYGLPEQNFRVAGIGGNAAIPPAAGTPRGLDFVFIAWDFARKGGLLCAEAFSQVHKVCPQATLTIVSQRPPDSVLQLPGVRYVGLLHKSNPEEARRFEEILGSAFAIVHPTTMDTIAQILIDVAYHGCPAVASNTFAIPEVVKDGVTGFLVTPPLTAAAFAERMLQLCRDRQGYLRMRDSARSFSTETLTWELVVGRIAQFIESHDRKPREVPA